MESIHIKNEWNLSLKELESEATIVQYPIVSIKNLVQNYFINGQYAELIPTDKDGFYFVQQLYRQYFLMQSQPFVRQLLGILTWIIAKGQLYSYSLLANKNPEVEELIVEALIKSAGYLAENKLIPSPSEKDFCSNCNWVCEELSVLIDDKLQTINTYFNV